MNGFLSKCLALVGTLLLMNMATGLGRAAVISTNNISLDSTPPLTIQHDVFQVDGLWYFEEAKGVTVTSFLSVDVGGGIPKDTTVNSYLVYHDPPDSSAEETKEGSLRFNVEILGVNYTPSRLNSSFGLEKSGHNYIYHADVGYETGEGDWATISLNSKTVTLHSVSSDFGESDFARVITAVPIPGAVWLLGSCVIGLVGLRRRFARK